MRTIKITGDFGPYEVTDETYEKIKALLEADKEPYQFQAGDVVRNHYGYKRIIVRFDGRLLAFDNDGVFIGKGQEYFERESAYKKIGELKDYIK